MMSFTKDKIKDLLLQEEKNEDLTNWKCSLKQLPKIIGTVSQEYVGIQYNMPLKTYLKETV